VGPGHRQVEEAHFGDNLDARLMGKPTEILLSADTIHKRVAELAGQIRKDFPADLHFVAVLKGAFVFLADLIRYVPGDVSIDFIAVASYADGTGSSGQVRLLKDLDMPIADRHVVIIEDVVDTGLTLVYLQEMLRARLPRTLATACLLSKPSRRRTSVAVDYVGFTIEDRFVVGYGLDHAERHRNLPHIAVLAPDESG
jgi:hypoxanthine phosphoribosyltransferase